MKTIGYIFKPKVIPKDKKGKFIVDKLPSDWNKTYGEAVVRYLNCFEPLFKEAQKKSEFQFILTLFRFRGMQPVIWDPYENSLEIFDEIAEIKNKVRDNIKLNLILWLYGHIVEASEPYETMANLFNICLGGAFRINNFPKIKTKWGYRPQYPIEKILYLQGLANKAHIPEALSPIKEIFDRDLRNAVFHSDYSVDDGEIILSDPSKIYSKKETLELMNRALAYHECFKNMLDSFRGGYTEPDVINADRISKNHNEKAMLIIRKDYGVIAMKAALTQEQIQQGGIPWFVGNIYAYENKLIDKGVYLLPRDRVRAWNKIIRKLPKSVGSIVAKFAEKFL